MSFCCFSLSLFRVDINNIQCQDWQKQTGFIYLCLHYARLSLCTCFSGAVVALAGSGAVRFSLAALQSLLCDSPSLPASAVQPDPQIPPGLLFPPLVFTVNTPLEGIRGEPSTCCISGGSEAAGAQSKPRRTSWVKLSRAQPARQHTCTFGRHARAHARLTDTSWASKDSVFLFVFLFVFYHNLLVINWWSNEISCNWSFLT